MEYDTKSRTELIALCKEKGVKGYSNKKKEDLVESLKALAIQSQPVVIELPTITKKTSKTKKEKLVEPQEAKEEPSKINRLNYIGSKFQLLDWLAENIKQQTGWTSFQDKTIADLFSGTGVVTHYFRQQGAATISNDAELYSAIITHAFATSTYTDICAKLIEELNEDKGQREGYITKNYSPNNGNERMFFTVENAKRIDHIRHKLEDLKPALTEDEYKFLLASLLLSADAVSNVPAVYGCYLKKFKAKAQKALQLKPIHTIIKPSLTTSRTTNSDVLADQLLSTVKADVVYLDPPYNERQYSKNYFPLNMIALTPTEQEAEKQLKGKTGIPESCFISPFCKKGKPVEEAFEKLFRSIQTKWFFVSYNSESLISKDRMVEIMKKYGDVQVVERDYKRFKSFEYNEDVAIKEYLFSIKTLRSEE